MKKCMALLLTVITFMSVALSGNTAKASAEYQYLQNVSEQEWQNMNHVEMIEACRIPDDILICHQKNYCRHFFPILLSPI